MSARSTACILALAVALAAGGASLAPAEDVPRHRIAGQVRDAAGAGVAGAVVVLCDADTGIPIDSRTSTPLAGGRGESPIEHVTWTGTDGDGRFVFPGLKPAAYRLVAQTWDGVGGVENLGAVHGVAVTLRGIADDVTVPSDEAEAVVLEPLGDGVLVYERGAGNDDWYLLVSTAPPGADPVLGFAGWRGPFARHVIGFNRMPYAQTIVRGLPEGAVAWVVFASDSRPGFGAGAGRIIRGHRQIIVADRDVVAGWSDARHDPPPRLETLTETVRALVAAGRTDELRRALAPPGGVVPEAPRSSVEVLEAIGPLERAIAMPDGSKTTVADLLAAWGYVRLQDSLARERQRRGGD